jgi:hypothetical protein
VASGGVAKTSNPWGTTLIALLACLVVLLLAGWLDALLVDQRNLATQEFDNLEKLLWVHLGARIILVAAWSGVAWLNLVRLPGRTLPGLIYLGLGGFVLLSPYAGMLAGLPVARLGWIVFTADFTSFTGAFFAVLGLLLLVAKTTPSQEPLEGGDSEG